MQLAEEVAHLELPEVVIHTKTEKGKKQLEQSHFFTPASPFISQPFSTGTPFPSEAQTR